VFHAQVKAYLERTPDQSLNGKLSPNGAKSPAPESLVAAAKAEAA
jgi:hypothetical protein